MRYLKYFEDLEENTQMGITEEEIKECFYDLEDEGWKISVDFKKKFSIDRKKVTKQNITDLLMPGSFEFDLIPYLSVNISRPEMHSRVIKIDDIEFVNKITVELTDTNIYKGCIGLLSSRLEDYNLFMCKEKIEVRDNGRFGSQIKILIYRKSDENYTVTC